MKENVLYRKKTCSYSDKAEALLRSQGIDFKVHVFEDAEEEQAFKSKHHVKTTPQVFLNGERIGGYSDLTEKFKVSESEGDEETSYIPVIAIFSVAALLSLATLQTFTSFMGFSLSLLALLKLMDIASFLKTFQKYDLLTKKFRAYGFLYPFLELLIGLGFLAIFAPKIVGAFSIVIGLLGAVSIFKAVYIEKLDLNCACVGGNSNVPLGAVSISENLMMLAMGIMFLFF